MRSSSLLLRLLWLRLLLMRVFDVNSRLEMKGQHTSLLVNACRELSGVCWGSFHLHNTAATAARPEYGGILKSMALLCVDVLSLEAICWRRNDLE